jgi:hypothetical protein
VAYRHSGQRRAKLIIRIRYHPGVDAALVEEHEAPRLNAGQLGPPRGPRLGQLGPVLLGGAQRLFSRQAELLEGPAHGRAARLDLGPLEKPGRVLGQGAVVALGHQLLQPVQRRLVQARRRAAGARLRLPPALRPPGLAPAVERALAHPEQGRDPSPAQPAALARQQHPLTQIRRVGPRHVPPPRAHHGGTVPAADGSQPA